MYAIRSYYEINADPAYVKQMTDYGFPLAYADAKGFTEVVDDYAAITDKVIKDHGLKEQK